MEIYIIATKSCSHYTNLKHAIEDFGEQCEVKFAEDHPELVEQFQIRTSPNLVVDNKIIFRHPPSESELKEIFTNA
ncbi:MAG: thioredoxin family protein [Thiohalomonadales bacterium]